MLKALKVCKKVGCNNLTRKAYCEDHKELRRENRKESNRYYNKYNRDSWTKKFYMGSEWLDTREDVLMQCNGIDLYEYYIHNKIVEADRVHHITELSDDRDKALDIGNLVPLSNSTHNTIHALYRKSASSKKYTMDLLYGLLERWNSGDRLH